jgi:hypothetical protein
MTTGMFAHPVPSRQISVHRIDGAFSAERTRRICHRPDTCFSQFPGLSGPSSHCGDCRMLRLSRAGLLRARFVADRKRQCYYQFRSWMAAGAFLLRGSTVSDGASMGRRSIVTWPGRRLLTTTVRVALRKKTRIILRLGQGITAAITASKTLVWHPPS